MAHLRKDDTHIREAFQIFLCVLLAQWLTWLTRTVVVVIQRCRVQSPLAARTFLEQESLTHEGPSIEILHTKIIFHKIPSILGIHMN